MAIMNFSGRMLKNLFSKPATTKYPYVKKIYPERTRGHIEISIEDCIFCSMCAKRCPTRVIHVDKSQKKWEIERFGCCQCGACVDVCPKSCLFMRNAYTTPADKKSTDVFVMEEKQEEK